MSERRSCNSRKEQDCLYKNILAMSERTRCTVVKTSLDTRRNMGIQIKERKMLGKVKKNRAKCSITKVCKDVLTKTVVTRIVTTRVEKRIDMEIEDRKKVDLSTLEREMEVVDAEIRRVQLEVEILEVELQKYLVEKEIDELQTFLERN